MHCVKIKSSSSNEFPIRVNRLFPYYIVSYIEDAKNMGEAEVGDDYKDDSIDVHDVLLVIAIACFEIDQPKNQCKKLKQYYHDAIITCRLLCKIVFNEYQD